MVQRIDTKFIKKISPASIALMLIFSQTSVHAEQKISTLRVCSDPGNMPLSNMKGEGFQDKIAKVLAESLNANLTYFWRPTIERGLTRKTFGEGKCDVMMSVPASMPRMITTRPYYRTTYVIAHRNDKKYDIKSLDDPIMKEAKVGVFQRSAAREALRRHGIKQNTIVHAMSWTGDLDEKQQPHQQVAKVTSGELDMAAVWGAFAGYHQKKLKEPLTIIPMNVLDDSVYLQFDMAIGIDRRRADLAKKIDQVLEKEKDKIKKILDDYGVPLVECSSCLISGNLPEHGPYGDITKPVQPGPGDGDVALEKLDKWLAEGADINQELNNAILSDDMPRIKYLLKKGADINGYDAQGYTPLTNALRNRYFRVAEYLIAEKADLELKDQNGWPPLLLSILKDDRQSMKALLDAGVSLTSVNSKGLSAIHTAVEFSSSDLIDDLLERGVDINAKNAAGYTPLMVAVAKQVDSSVQVLLDKSADVNSKNKVGVTALMIATAGKNKKLVERLINANALTTAETNDGQTAETIARRNGFFEGLALLQAGSES